MLFSLSIPVLRRSRSLVVLNFKGTIKHTRIYFWNCHTVIATITALAMKKLAIAAVKRLSFISQETKLQV